jgi:miniconductance mechanosensitive channel
VDWVPYERLQADVFDHLIAVVKEFGLKIYQAPSGDDLLNISLNQQLKQS